jgi:hypothetical protein
MQVVVDQIAAILKVLAFRQHVGGNQDIDFPAGPNQFRSLVRLGRETPDDAGAFSAVGAAVHPPDMRAAQFFLKRRRAGVFGVADLAVEIARGVPVVGKDQDLLAAQSVGQEFLELRQLGIGFGPDILDQLPDFRKRPQIMLDCLVELAQVVLGMIDSLHPFQRAAGFFVRIHLAGAGLGNRVVLFVFG